MDETLQSTSPLGASDRMLPVTLTHLVLILLFALAAILVIWWGMRLRRRRRQADAQLRESGRGTPIAPEAAGAPLPEVDQPQADDVAVEPVPVPVSPVPPPAPPPPVAPVAVETPAAAPAPIAAAAPAAIELTRLKGLGPRAAAALNQAGIHSLAELAALSPAEAERIDASLGPLAGRMARDRWVEQAQLLQAGDIAGYEARFGKLG